MVKPQFELGRGRVGKGGVVRSAEDRREAVGERDRGRRGARPARTGVAAAGVPGPKGNRGVFVLLARRRAGGADMSAAIEAAIA